MKPPVLEGSEIAGERLAVLDEVRLGGRLEGTLLDGAGVLLATIGDSGRPRTP